MAVIVLPCGAKCLVDDEDLALLEPYKWRLSHRGYAVAYSRYKTVFMHRLIIEATKGVFVDHKNMDKLDNRKVNLRLCTGTQNNANTKLSTRNSLGYKGIGRKGQRYFASVKIAGKSFKFNGNYATPAEAAARYDQEAVRIFGEFAKTNKSLGLL